MRVEAEITLELCDPKVAEALFKALVVEARNPPDPDRGVASVELMGTSVLVKLGARDYPSARALLNAFLSLASSLTDTISNLAQSTGRSLHTNSANRESSSPGIDH